MRVGTRKARLPGSPFLLLAVFIPLAFIPLQPAGADTRYVDRSATGSNNGSSWADAWTSLSRIDWSQVTAGDTIQISGGAAFKTYDETLTVGSSGASGRPITITGGLDAGHNGTVIIDGQMVREHAVDVTGRSHVTLRNLDLRGATGSGQVYIDGCSYVLVEGLAIFVTGHGGVFLQESTGCVVRRCTITTPSTDFDAQTDGIYAQRNRGNIYENNRIVISNQNAGQHCDGIQMYQETSPTVRGNYIEQNNGKTYNAQGIYATIGFGTYLIYNNVVYCPNTLSQLIGHRNLGTTSTAKIYNNTVIGRSGNCIRVSGRFSEVKNNIVYRIGSGCAIRVDDAPASFSQVDYNTVYNDGGDAVYYDPHSDGKTWPEWQAMGAEAHGQFANPLINVPSGTLQPGSPAISRALDLRAVFSEDKSGAIRPAGCWSTGAYEYGSADGSGTGGISGGIGSSQGGPAAPRNLRVLD